LTARRGLLLAAAALVLVGCGGGDPSASGGDVRVVPAERWIADFCAAGAAWRADLDRNARALTRTLEEARTAREARAELVRYFDDAAALTDATVARVERSGLPDVDERERLAGDIAGLVADVGHLFAAAADETERLATRDEQRLRARVRAIARRLEARAAALTTRFERIAATYDVPELDRAFGENDDCKRLAGG
jgi:hypothetical protein